MRPLPKIHLPGDVLPLYDAVVIGDYQPREVIAEVVQLLGFDADDVLSVSITAGEVAVITADRDDAGKLTSGRTLHRHVVR